MLLHSFADKMFVLHHAFLALKDGRSDCRRGSAVKTISALAEYMGSQHLHRGSYLSVTAVLEDQMPS